jgi:hypothetical protein
MDRWKPLTLKKTTREVATRAASAVLGHERAHRLARHFDPAWQAFVDQSVAIDERHWKQTHQTVAALKRKYEEAVFGRERIWTLVERLADCIDPSDGSLGGASQLVHVRQVVAGMEAAGVSDPSLFLAAITHDLGKVLLLTAEAPENIVCMNAPIGEYPAGVGLDQVVFQWNHDEFIYSRLKDALPDHVAWLVRYHSIVIDATRPYMNARDLEYLEKYLLPFRTYDQGTKSCFAVPPRDVLDKYRDLVETTCPGALLI